MAGSMHGCAALTHSNQSVHMFLPPYPRFASHSCHHDHSSHSHTSTLVIPPLWSNTLGPGGAIAFEWHVFMLSSDLHRPVCRHLSWQFPLCSCRDSFCLFSTGVHQNACFTPYVTCQRRGVKVVITICYHLFVITHFLFFSPFSPQNGEKITARKLKEDTDKVHF